jgi:hypothetical protein
MAEPRLSHPRPGRLDPNPDPVPYRPDGADRSGYGFRARTIAACRPGAASWVNVTEVSRAYCRVVPGALESLSATLTAIGAP